MKDPSTLRWRKSRHSDQGGEDCLEISGDIPGAVPIRDSKRIHATPLMLSPRAWHAFTKALANGGLQ